ncbi:hypothetical protein P5706_15555 [Pseudomonas sp. ChxA]|uniref:hypothetical protein n=1 Tax=Pseudomonas sp. ChxA TaxID=3035473 RepID=UPI002556B879|nr:hypothetical protein [Pseudomonas sp. ChxA]MDL2185600.1 hypothetical protein [Pseudomonas sp. ChxA]
MFNEDQYTIAKLKAQVEQLEFELAAQHFAASYGVSSLLLTQRGMVLDQYDIKDMWTQSFGDIPFDPVIVQQVKDQHIDVVSLTS